MSDARKVVDQHTSESELLDQIIDLAVLSGWRVHHPRPGRTKHGWVTPIQGHRGLPDLIAVKGRRLIFAEVKTESGRLTPDQTIWLDTLREVSDAAPLVGVYVWRPSDWPEIVEVLT